MRSCVPSSKKLSRRVRPGVLLVRARPWRWVIALMALDLPAFERPTKATSAPRSGGNCPGAAALIRKRPCENRLTSVVYNSAPSHHGTKRKENNGEDDEGRLGGSRSAGRDAQSCTDCSTRQSFY